MKIPAARLFVLAVVVMAAGCGPEYDCKEGLRQLRPRIDGATGTGAHREAEEQIIQARMELAAAEDSQKAGDFAACVQQIESARVLLNKSQRTNQQ